MAGRLKFAARVVISGRVFTRRIIDAISGLRSDSHNILLCGFIRQDIIWWHLYMRTFNGVSLILHTQPMACGIMDACTQCAGGFFQGDYLYCNWKLDWPQFQHDHIHVKDTLAVVLAAHRWALTW
jgi:hypothetical protein